jgi:hypothetical protein
LTEGAHAFRSTSRSPISRRLARILASGEPRGRSRRAAAQPSDSRLLRLRGTEGAVAGTRLVIRLSAPPVASRCS